MTSRKKKLKILKLICFKFNYNITFDNNNNFFYVRFHLFNFLKFQEVSKINQVSNFKKAFFMIL